MRCILLHSNFWISIWGKKNNLQKIPHLVPLLFLSPRTSMLMHSVGGRSTRSICLVLACLSLTLHILLAIFCLSVLQTACVLPHSSSSSSSPLHDHGSTSRQRKSSVSNGIFAHNATEWEKEPVDPGGSKLEALFSHPLYNLPRPEMQEDDWLLRVKTSEDEEEEEERDIGSEEVEDW